MRNILPKNARLVPEHAERVFKGIIYDVYHWEQEMFDGSMQTFEMLKRPDTVEIIAIKDGKVVVLNEQQPGRDPYLCLPAGRHDHEDEDELAAARRELREETGLTFRTWRLLAVTQATTKIEHFWYIFLATDFEAQIKQQLDVGEKISVELWDYAKFKQRIDDPQFRFLPRHVLDRADSLQELLDLPEYA
jgi:8-oxo-dGTP pyrophosphatase MutT (NUDIX family)